MNRDVRTCAEWIRDDQGPVPTWVRAAAARLLAPRRPIEKVPVPSVVHHDEYLHELKEEREATKVETWNLVLQRTCVDHRGWFACEACHARFTSDSGLEPHHLVLGERTDAPELVMALCAGCHRLGPKAAHRRPRAFAQHVVVPWAQAHGFELPHRKEFRT